MKFKKLVSTFLAAAFIVSSSTGVLASSHHNEDTLGEPRIVNHPILGEIHLSGEYVTERIEVEIHDEFGNLLISEYFYVDIPIEEFTLGGLLYEQDSDSANSRLIDLFPTHFTANSTRNLGGFSGSGSLTISFSSDELLFLDVFAVTRITGAHLSGSGTRLSRVSRLTLTAPIGTIAWDVSASNPSFNTGSATFVSH